MDADTPLDEVCALLPKESAQLLLYAPQPTVTVTLGAVRSLLVDLEQSGHPIDPISLDVVLQNYVMHIAGLHSMVVVATVAAMEGSEG